MYDTSIGDWLNPPINLSQARAWLAGAAAGGLILFAGGQNEAGYSDVVDVFDTSRRDWLLPMNLSQPRSRLAGAAAGGLILFAGGEKATTYPTQSKVVDVFNASTRSWLPPANLSYSGGARLVGAAAGDLIAFSGGAYCLSFQDPCDDDDLDPNGLMDVFNTTGSLVDTASLGHHRHSLGAAAAGDLILFAGGQIGSYYYASVTVYDTTQRLIYFSNYYFLNLYSALSQARSHLAGASAGGVILFAGGYTEFSGKQTALHFL
jgi:hypothetical protein